MNAQETYEFMKKERLAVLATVAEDGQPKAALIGVAVTPQLEMVFDTVKSSPEISNLKKNPRVAFVIFCGPSGWTYEGKLAGHYLFCSAAKVGEVLRLQSGKQKD